MKSKMFENDKKDECEIGFWIGEKYWGNGFATEAGERLINRAFEDLGMNVIWVNYFTGNEKSKRIQEKLGFVYYKTFKNENIKLLEKVTDFNFTRLTREIYLLNTGR